MAFLGDFSFISTTFWQEEDRSQADDVIASMKPGPVVGSYTIAAPRKTRLRRHFEEISKEKRQKMVKNR